MREIFDDPAAGMADRTTCGFTVRVWLGITRRGRFLWLRLGRLTMTDQISVQSRYRIAVSLLLLGGVAVFVALGKQSGVEATVWMTGLVGSVVSLMVLDLLLIN